MSRNTRGTRRSDLKTRRSSRGGSKSRFLYFLRKFGAALALIVLVGWLASWLILSGAAERSWNWSKRSLINSAAENGFRVENILIEGRYHTDPELLKAILNTEQGDPLLDFDPAAIQPLIEKISWVKKASVLRRLPDTIHIILEERVPFALWQNDSKVVVIDRDGVVLTDQMQDEFQDLLLLTGDQAPRHAAELIDLLHAEPLIFDQIEAAIFIGNRRWDLKLKNGMTVRLPEQDMGLALRRLAEATETEFLLSKDIQTIDLREADRMIVESQALSSQKR
ncbi:MAG: FtsQ-type POTRA domain-containing protein [Rhodospirillales bacterium]|nr:FtsQ-type POTRA domain-containing protein [Rhodospirillales bacterium]